MTPTRLELALDSEAIGAAAGMRVTGEVQPHRLFDLSKSDAEDLLRKVRGQTLVNHSLTVGLHLDEKGLQGSIYRHAMIHAGAFVNVSTQKPYETCPRCGSELTWPEN